MRYSITELERCRLTAYIAIFSHLLKSVNFDAVLVHLTLTHIMKSKSKSATNRIQRLLEIMSSCTFSFYYLKDKDMILSGFLL